MKRIALLLTVMILVSAPLAFAQNWKVETGKMEYQSGEYEKSLATLKDALETKDKLKDKQRAAAYVYTAMSYMRIAQDKTLGEKFPDAAIKASEYFSEAKKQTSIGKYKKEMTMGETMLNPLLFNSGVLAYQDGKYEKAKGFLQESAKLDAKAHKTHLILGYINLNLGDTTEAQSSLRKSIDLHAENSASAPDSLMPAAYLILAELAMKSGDNKEALKTVESGLEVFPKNPELKKTELHVYQQSSELLAEAETKFKDAMDKNPDDLQVKLAYAGLLEKGGKKVEAVKLYKEALEKDPKNYVANVNLGVYYINNASELSKKYNETNDENLLASYKTQIKQNLTDALPYMKKAHELEPKNPDWLTQLSVITSYLGMDEESLKYIRLKKALQN